MIRPDNRLEDLPMTSLRCRSCAAVVQARKSSWEQTSIQWDEQARNTCLERQADRAERRFREADFPTCSALRESIAEAAVTCELTVAAE